MRRLFSRLVDSGIWVSCSNIQAWDFSVFLRKSVFSEPFGSFLRSMQIRFNNFRGGGGGGEEVHTTLRHIYGLSILPLCDFYWLLSTLNIAICDASLLLSPSISTADVSCTRDQQYACIIAVYN